MEQLVKYTQIDIANWKRSHHYNFFKNFEQPFFGVCTEINCTAAYNYCKAYRQSFLMYYLHKSLLAANQVKEFKYRMKGGGVVEYHQISGSITVLRNDETFGFAYFDYTTNFGEFARQARQVIDAEKLAAGEELKFGPDSVIHYSILPDIKFTSMQHAQMLTANDSVPKVVFGKLDFRDGQAWLPVSVHVHHALCDGFHVGQFIKAYQLLMEV